MTLNKHRTNGVNLNGDVVPRATLAIPATNKTEHAVHSYPDVKITMLRMLSNVWNIVQC